MADRQHGSGYRKRSVEDHGTAYGPDSLAGQLSRYARSLEAEDDFDQMMQELVAAAVKLIPGAEEGSISVVIGRRQSSSHYPTGDLPRLVDAVQDEVGEGPCLDAAYEHVTVRVPDMTSEQRWPNFAKRASQVGAASMLSLQLYVEGDNLGALNLFARRRYAFDQEAEQIGLLFASHAAIAFSDARKIAQFHQGMLTRDVIGQAKGILMERYKMTPMQAFRVLVRLSQDSNRKLRDVAEQLATTGLLPSVPASSSPADAQDLHEERAPGPLL